MSNDELKNLADALDTVLPKLTSPYVSITYRRRRPIKWNIYFPSGEILTLELKRSNVTQNVESE